MWPYVEAFNLWKVDLERGSPNQPWFENTAHRGLSQAKAELGGIRKGASTCPGRIGTAKNRGRRVQPDIQTDAAAALGIGRRKGGWPIRHLATADVWVQDKLNPLGQKTQKA